MIVFELTKTEANDIYQELQFSNVARQYDFLRSIVVTSLKLQRLFLSQHIIKSLNFHAITCLHTNAGEFRPCPVIVGSYVPPQHYQVQALMDDFVNETNSNWHTVDPVALSAFVLWKLNHIHPFINGNGRTARAASYFVLCVKLGGLLGGAKILPELLVRDRPRYVSALQEVDASVETGAPNLRPLQILIEELLGEQLAS